MKKNLLLITAVAVIAVVALSCKKETTNEYYTSPVLPDAAMKYGDISFPTTFNFMNNNTPNDNEVTDDGATLGRVLFYDAKLSINNAISCGSCHKQFRGFADGNDFSKGYQNLITKRNSLSIVNAQFESSFFWDGRVENLEDMVLAPIQNHIEMGMEKLDVLETKLSKFNYYPPLFEKAFGTTEINKENIAAALSQFIRSLVSYNTKFDVAIENHFTDGGLWGGSSSIDTSNWEELTPIENLGKNLFFVKLPCGSCHGSANLGGTNDNFSNIGLDMNYSDNGWVPPIWWESSFAADGFFKVPSLRNVARTAPYMHDGRFNTLEEVIEHYNSGIQNHPQLNFSLTNEGWAQQNGGGIFIDPMPNFSPTPLKMNLTETEKKALIAFLNTLTDEHLLTDSKFADPFAN